MQSRKQIFCFTHAGGSASFFNVIEKDLPEYDLVMLEYPGHGKRYREACCEDMGSLADDAYSVIKHRYTGGEYALFGYSMGSAAAAEVLLRISKEKTLPKPCHVFIAAHVPFEEEKLFDISKLDSDEYIRERTLLFGGIPSELSDSKAFWRLYIPLFRADYSIIVKYRMNALSDVTDVPATVFYSESDTVAFREFLKKKYKILLLFN